jgi:hypothetical protein
MKALVLLLIGFCVSANIYCQSNFEKSQQLLKEKKYEEAVKAFKKSI